MLSVDTGSVSIYTVHTNGGQGSPSIFLFLGGAEQKLIEKRCLDNDPSSLVTLWFDLCDLRAYPIDQYPCRSRQAASIMLMIMNNLDPAVAQVTCRDLLVSPLEASTISNHFLSVLPLSSRRSWSPTEAMDRCSATGRR